MLYFILKTGHVLKSVAFITDSMAFPREDTQLSSTFISLLQKESNFQFFHIGIGGGDIRLFTDQFARIRNHVDIIILCFGISDAIPRALNNYELEFFSLTGIKLSHRLNVLLRKIRKISRTSYLDFKNLCYAINFIQENFESKNSASNLNTLIVLPINPIPSKIEESHPGAYQKVILYNQIFKTVFKNNFVDTYLDINCHLSPDGIHLNKLGHQMVYKKLKTILVGSQ